MELRVAWATFGQVSSGAGAPILCLEGEKVGDETVAVVEASLYPPPPPTVAVAAVVDLLASRESGASWGLPWWGPWYSYLSIDRQSGTAGGSSSPSGFVETPFFAMGSALD